jgi:hypothetical protein
MIAVDEPLWEEVIKSRLASCLLPRPRLGFYLIVGH